MKIVKLGLHEVSSSATRSTQRIPVFSNVNDFAPGNYDDGLSATLRGY